MSTPKPQVDCILEYIRINSVPIQVAQFGFNSSIFKSFDPLNKSSKLGETCLIFIPGEVGDITTYLNFLKNLYSKLNETLPIIALSHNGHSNVTNEIVYDSYSAKYQKNFTHPLASSILFNKNLFNLHGQVQSKLIFLKKFLPIDVKLFFISHGIGAYISLQILNSYPMLNVPQINMIAPSIENIHLTYLGKMYLYRFKHFKTYIIDKLIILYKLFALYYFNWLFSLLCLDKLAFYLYKKLFVKFFFSEYDFVDAWLIPYLVLLLEDSVQLVKDINYNLMKYLSSRIKMIYFTKDHMNYPFFSLANRRRFALSTFVVSNCEHLANRTKSLIRRSNLSKQLKHDLIKEVDTLANGLEKTLHLVHDFQTNNCLSKLLSTHVAVEILNKLNEPKRVDSELHLTFASKEGESVKSVSKIMEK